MLSTYTHLPEHNQIVSSFRPEVGDEVMFGKGNQPNLVVLGSIGDVVEFTTVPGTSIILGSIGDVLE
jgi:hypothetical protein